MLKPKKVAFYFIAILICLLGVTVQSLASTSIDKINNLNLPKNLNKILFLPEGNGSIAISPSDILILTKIIKPGITIEVKKYKEEPSFNIETLEALSDLVLSYADIKDTAKIFAENDVKIEVYPTFRMLTIMINNAPYAKVEAISGPETKGDSISSISQYGEILWAVDTLKPTQHGIYKFLGYKQNYQSSLYPETTGIPFGSVLLKNGRDWSYSTGEQRYALPQKIVQDLESQKSEKEFSYYGIKYDREGKIIEAQWGSNELGRYVMFYAKNDYTENQNMIYSPGAALYKNIKFIELLSDFFTSYSIEELYKNPYIANCKEAYDFLILNTPVSRTIEAVCYKLFYELPISTDEAQYLPQEIVDGFYAYKNRDKVKLKKGFDGKYVGEYAFVLNNALSLQERGEYFKFLVDNQVFFNTLKTDLKKDFEIANVFSPTEQKQLIFDWLQKRLEFKTVEPLQSKSLSFYDFFKKSDENYKIDQKDKDYFRSFVAQAKGANLQIFSAEEINRYNFGVLLNQILGNLYKSHGCLHLSPRDAYLVYSSIPVGSRINIFNYNKLPNLETLEALPYLADLVDFKEDLTSVASTLASSITTIEVFPLTGDWIIHEKSGPFAKLSIKGGPKEKMHMVERWDEFGNPIFSPNLAYPTSSGTFYIFKKVESYQSKLYKDTTSIPMGAVIKKKGDYWIFEDLNGNWKRVPEAISIDLAVPQSDRDFAYYDTTTDKDGSIIQTRWGSHDFGKYSLTMSKNKKSQIPEVIHTAGDLMLEQRNLVGDLIELLATPGDSFDECIKFNTDFSFYKTCYDFTRNISSETFSDPIISGNYKAYYGIPLSEREAKVVSPYAVIATRVLKNNMALSDSEKELLIKGKIATIEKKKFKINKEKLSGINFDSYQYAIYIQKLANHYTQLRDHWDGLTKVREAMLKDFQQFTIKDPVIFKKFIKEMVLKRVDLQAITSEDVYKILEDIIEKS